MDRLRKAALGALLAVAVVLVALIVLHPALFAGKIYASSDARAVEAFKVVGDRMLEAGVYPLWNPYVFCGMPSLASLAYTPGIYPLEQPVDKVAKALGLPPMTWLLVHLWILGLGTACYLRWRGFSWPAALAAALALLAMPKLMAWCAYGHGTKVLTIAWLPWILWMAEGVLRRGHPAWAFGLAVFTGVALRRGHPQILYFIVMAAVLWYLFLAWELWRRRGGRVQLGRRTAWLALAAVLALGASLILYLPVLNYQAHSIRGSAGTGGGVAFDYATAWSLGWNEVATLWWPTAVGYGKASYVGSMPFTDYPNYVGAPLLLLALLGLLLRRSRWTWMLLVLVVFSTLAALGKHFFLYRLLYEVLPGFNKFRVPVMILILQSWALVLLAAAGMDEIVAVVKGERPRPPWLGRPAVVLLVSVGVLLVLLGTVGSGALRESSLQRWAQARPGLPYSALRPTAAMAAGDAVRLGLVLLAGLATLAATRRGRLPATGAVAVLGLLVFLDLWAVDRPIVHPESHLRSLVRTADGGVEAVPAGPTVREHKAVRDFVASNEAIDFLTAQEEAPRIWPLFDLFEENLYSAHGIESLGGYHPAKLKVYEDLRRRLDVRSASVALPLVDLLAAGWVLSPGDLGAGDLEQLAQRGLPLEKAFQGEGGVVYRNLADPPRQWLVHAWEAEAPGRDTTGQEPAPDVLERVLAPGFDFHRQVILSAAPEPAPGPADPGDEIRLVEWSWQHRIYETDAAAPAVAVLSQIYYPGWRATVDGREAPLLRADHALQAVALPEGRHTLRMDYVEPSFVTGRRISRLSALIMGTGLVLSLALPAWRRRRDGGGGGSA